MKEGFGRMIFKSGSRYEGKFSFLYKSRISSKGQFKQDMRNGKGTYWFYNGMCSLSKVILYLIE